MTLLRRGASRRRAGILLRRRDGMFRMRRRAIHRSVGARRRRVIPLHRRYRFRRAGANIGRRRRLAVCWTRHRTSACVYRWTRRGVAARSILIPLGVRLVPSVGLSGCVGHIPATLRGPWDIASLGVGSGLGRIAYTSRPVIILWSIGSRLSAIAASSGFRHVLAVVGRMRNFMPPGCVVPRLGLVAVAARRVVIAFRPIGSRLSGVRVSCRLGRLRASLRRMRKSASAGPPGFWLSRRLSRCRWVGLRRGQVCVGPSGRAVRNIIRTGMFALRRRRVGTPSRRRLHRRVP